jgi:bifunctional non-homologous end joining protein LigD
VTPPSRAAGQVAGDPGIREPQKATLVDYVPAGSGWLYEMKYDGYRCQLAIGGGKAKVYTRSGLDWSEKFPEIAEAAASLEVGSALLDGEIVSLDAEGRTNFSALQAAISAGGRGLNCFLFDALEIDGEDLTKLPMWSARRGWPISSGEGRARSFMHSISSARASNCCRHVRRRPGRRDREEGGGALSLRAHQDLAEDQMHAPAGIRGDRLDRQLQRHARLRSLILAVTEGDTLRFAGKVGTGFSMDVEAHAPGQAQAAGAQVRAR